MTVGSAVHAVSALASRRPGSRQRHRLAGIALAVLAGLSCTLVDDRGDDAHPSGGSASPHPPGGLAAHEVPLFVQFGFDDNGISGRDGSGTSGGMRFVTDLFAGKRNADGSPAAYSLYVATRYITASDIDSPAPLKLEWRRAVDAGHEIAVHTHEHAHGARFSTRRWSREIATCVDRLSRPFAAARTADPGIGIGIPRDAILGFRAPFLEYGPALFPALRRQGLVYDCSVEEGFGDRDDGTNFVWPYRVAPHYGGRGPAGDRELWEIPVYALIVPPDETCARYGVEPGLRARLHRIHDYLDPADGKITGFDWNLWVDFGMTPRQFVATFKYSLDRRLAGNRAPLTFGAHSDIYSEQYARLAGSTAEQRRRALTEVLEYALSHPEVRVVTARRLVGWLRSPTPLAAEGSTKAGR